MAATRRVILVSLVALVLAACGTAGTPVRYPATIGVVATVTPPPGRNCVVLTLTDGRTFETCGKQVVNREPGEGDLLLAGDLPEPWVGALAPMPGAPGCWNLYYRSVRTADGIEILETGVRLPVADSFDPTKNPGDAAKYDNESLCVDAQGRVYSAGMGPD